LRATAIRFTRFTEQVLARAAVDRLWVGFGGTTHMQMRGGTERELSEFHERFS
jgi:hypothetical protein